MLLAHSIICRHDFVVVETIDFYADEDAELPPPMTQRDVMLLNRAGAMDEEEAAAPDAAAGDARGKVGLLGGSLRQIYALHARLPDALRAVSPEGLGMWRALLMGTVYS